MTSNTAVRNWLVLFGLLDAILLGRFMDGITFAWPHFPPRTPLWLAILYGARPLFMLSLAASAYGLATERKWGFVLSYIQFPFRYLYMLLSFGFLTLAAPWIPYRWTYTGIIILAFVLEAVRLGITIWANRRLFGGPRLQFSLSSMLVVVSICCALFAAVRAMWMR